MNSYSAIISMASIFEQSVAQFALLHTFARLLHDNHTPAQLIRNLFPKAQFCRGDVIFEIAWSFLSHPIPNPLCNSIKTWRIVNEIHRIGGLPAEESPYIATWRCHDYYHRIDRDLRTGLTLPAIIEVSVNNYWYQNGTLCRDDCDLRTGLALPCHIANTGGNLIFEWIRRTNRDLMTGIPLPRIIKVPI